MYLRVTEKQEQVFNISVGEHSKKQNNRRYKKKKNRFYDVNKTVSGSLVLQRSAKDCVKKNTNICIWNNVSTSAQPPNTPHPQMKSNGFVCIFKGTFPTSFLFCFFLVAHLIFYLKSI